MLKSHSILRINQIPQSNIRLRSNIRLKSFLRPKSDYFVKRAFKKRNYTPSGISSYIPSGRQQTWRYGCTATAEYHTSKPIVGYMSPHVGSTCSELPSMKSHNHQTDQNSPSFSTLFRLWDNWPFQIPGIHYSCMVSTCWKRGVSNYHRL